MIKEAKWFNHQVLGDLMLNFEKPNGGIYNTIIFAGENGCGKTTILSTLSDFLNLGSFEPFEYIRYEVDGNKFKIFRDRDTNASLGFHVRENESTGNQKQVRTNKNNLPHIIQDDNDDIRRYGCVYSKARSGFRTDKVQATTTQQLDTERYSQDNSDNFTFIKQLIVDIDSQDNSDWMRISRAHSGETIDSFSARSKLSRFQKAFDGFFDNVKFNGVDQNDSSEKKIIFTKYGRDISIDNLSTGEKQIVFRGAYLLKNSNYLSKGIVLIDEPELSMHPKWQGKILQYYRSLFIQGGNQNTQIFMATHSEYVIKAALQDRDNVLVIVLKDNHGSIEVSRIITPFVLPSITDAEVNYYAFGVLTTDYHIQLYGCLHNKINQNASIMDCDQYIRQSPDYNAAIHHKPYTYNNRSYQTLPTYIRNVIDHPDSGHQFTEEELKTSIELLIKLCQ